MNNHTDSNERLLQQIVETPAGERIRMTCGAADLRSVITDILERSRASVAAVEGDALQLIAAERQRQIVEEGYDANHDDDYGHDGGEIARAAAAYALGGGRVENIMQDTVIDIWPTAWGAEEDTIKRKPRIRQLVIAGALIVAEIERLQRLDNPAASSSLPAELPTPDPFAMSRCTASRDGFPCGWLADALVHTDESLNAYHQFQVPAPAEPLQPTGEQEVSCPDCVEGKLTAGCAIDRPLISVDCGRCKGTGRLKLPTINLPFSMEDIRRKASEATTPPETPAAAIRAAREWMNTYHAAFKTNKEREEALAAIITRHLATPGEQEVGLNLLRQLVSGKNALRQLNVFWCNHAEHDAGCKCFWEQCEAWARQDAAASTSPETPVGGEQ